jgi:hypothetical protein
MNGMQLSYEYDQFAINNLMITPPLELLGKPLKTAVTK